MMVDTYWDLCHERKDALIAEEKSEEHVLKLVVEGFDSYGLQMKMIYCKEVVVVRLGRNWGDNLLEVQKQQHVEEGYFCACYLNEVVVGVFESFDRFLILISVDVELVKFVEPCFGRQKQIKELYLVLYQVVDWVYSFLLLLINYYTKYKFINLFDVNFKYMYFNFYW